ncbi:E3 SUMO-protein ligase SIZ1-like [Apium graveolens]|uniref:E3 SUMO-protein ligase SIZ1-like n=1 Tax=Apium graveolens TaxID=4045 RepID=UPI003D7A8762
MAFLTFCSAPLGASTSALSDTFRTEEVAKLIQDVHRNMVAETYESAHAGQTRCPCGSPSPDFFKTDMIEVKFKLHLSQAYCDFKRCKFPDCHVLQHKVCVQGLRAVPPHFHCEVCRINRADLLWVGMKNFLYPTRLELPEFRGDGTNNTVNLNTDLEIQGRDLDLIDREGYKIQVLCILPNDAAQFRIHWPKYSLLEVNGIEMGTVDRPQNQLLGANGHDSGALISMCLKEGLNKITFSAQDNRIFCLGVRLVRPRTIKEICEVILKEQEGETLNDAKARVIRCLRGGTTSHGNADRDFEVLSKMTVNLRCSISGARMKTASRFKPCVHMACFDLESFIGLRQTAKQIEQSGEDTTEIKIRSDGSWFVDHRHSTSLRVQYGLSSPSRTTNNDHGFVIVDLRKKSEPYEGSRQFFDSRKGINESGLKLENLNTEPALEASESGRVVLEFTEGNSDSALNSSACQAERSPNKIRSYNRAPSMRAGEHQTESKTESRQKQLAHDAHPRARAGCAQRAARAVSVRAGSSGLVRFRVLKLEFYSVHVI